MTITKCRDRGATLAGCHNGSNGARHRLHRYFAVALDASEVARSNRRGYQLVIGALGEGY